MAASCDGCGEVKAGLKLCTRCRDCSYCSVECQRQNWAEHKKVCRPNYRREAHEAIDRAIADEALAPHEVQTLKLNLNRIEGNSNNHDVPNDDENERMARIDTSFMYALSGLFAGSQGVLVEGRAGDPPKFGYVVENASSGSDRALMQIWLKKKHQMINVQLVDKNGRNDGDVVSVEPRRLRMVPIRDSRHLQYSGDETIPAGIDPDEHVFEDDSLPSGYLEDGEWVDYPRGLACRIESLYDCNSPHYLYTPGNPHTSGHYSVPLLSGDNVNNPLMGFYHGTSTRQIIFEASSRGAWVRGPHNQTDNMTERDFCTGMKRRVRRTGGTPRAGGDRDGHKQQSMMIFESGLVDWTDTRERCGLCGKTDGPFTTTDCCGATVCDTEGQYELGSYERAGQCARNHRLHSICAHHNYNSYNHDEEDWKKCKQCEDAFHPYDYAVKATAQSVSGSARRYNFEGNVRTDIHPADVPFPTCSDCGVNVDTTEESLETLRMRKSFGGGKAICSKCGGGFGKVKPQW